MKCVGLEAAPAAPVDVSGGAAWCTQAESVCAAADRPGLRLLIRGAEHSAVRRARGAVAAHPLRAPLLNQQGQLITPPQPSLTVPQVDSSQVRGMQQVFELEHT